MEQAIDALSGLLVAAKRASSMRSYNCPRPGCGGRVYLARGVVQRPHFRHFPGEGAPECDEYFPGPVNGSEDLWRTSADVEDDPSQLGLLLAQVDGRWGLGLRLPEIPSIELGESSLSALRSAFVDLYAGPVHVSRVGALELRPGVGAARIDVVPALQAYRTQTAGIWPNSIDHGRWHLRSRELEAKGVLFRLRGGEWTRLVARSGVHPGESLLVLADARCIPPIGSEVQPRISNAGLEWCIWEVRLPNEDHDKVARWLALLGHKFISRPWRTFISTPARAFGKGGEPIFWTCDVPVLTIEAPHRAATAAVSFQTETSADSARVTASQVGAAQIAIKAQDVGVARFDVAGERSASIEMGLIRQPSHADVLEQLALTPRLRLCIGTQKLEAWQASEHSIRFPLRKRLEVRADLGGETARARVAVWEHGKKRTWRDLDARGVERVIDQALVTASRIEIDGDNLGRVVALIKRGAIDNPREFGATDRLVWRDKVASLSSRYRPGTVPTLVEQPGTRALMVYRLDAATLVRSRLALRRGLRAGGNGP